jgi:hypothetical protein
MSPTPLLSRDEIATTLDAIDAMVRELVASGGSTAELVGTLHGLRCGKCGAALPRPRDPSAAELFDLLCAWWDRRDDADPIATD